MRDATASAAAIDILASLDGPNPGWRLAAFVRAEQKPDRPLFEPLCRSLVKYRSRSTNHTAEPESENSPFEEYHGLRALDQVDQQVGDLSAELRVLLDAVRLNLELEVNGQRERLLNGIVVRRGLAVESAQSKEPDTAAQDTRTRSEAALEILVGDSGQPLNAARFTSRLATIEPCVCRVNHGSGFATGFLVGPQLVLTAYHVVEAFIDDVRRNRDVPVQPLAELTVQFDETITADGQRKQGVLGRVLEIVDYSPYDPSDLQGRIADSLPAPDLLDYALLRLESPVPERSAATGERVPGWRMGIAVPTDDKPFEPGGPLLGVHCPEGRPAEIVIGRIAGVNANSTRIWYELETRVGSSGMPCFNRDLELVALHHRRISSDGQSTIGEGISISAIRDMLRRRGKLAGVTLDRSDSAAS